ncbi:hypothetical protein BSKO_03465 [Bryopsis sp. KO-2023]|nr:hypothetical protein BSKO_03465 [Bryopsis sp. KO-2023]
MASGAGSSSVAEVLNELSLAGGTNECVDAQASVASGGNCPVCMRDFDLVDMAMVPGCEHVYCVYCLIQWSAVKDPCNCPQCKRKMESILCFRQLDGTVTDDMREEGLCLLRRANWYKSKIKEIERTTPGRTNRRMPSEEDCYFGYDEEDIDEVEDYYFSSAAGHARIVLGNRRFGRSGYISAGHNYAQPVGAGGKKGKKKKNATSGSNDQPAQQGNPSTTFPPLGGSTAASGSGSTQPTNSSNSGGGGKRSRRKAKKGNVVAWE